MSAFEIWYAVSEPASPAPITDIMVCFLSFFILGVPLESGRRDVAPTFIRYSFVGGRLKSPLRLIF